MATPENPKVGGCYIWVISFLLFICTVSGAIFLVLYMIQPTSTTTTTTSWYLIIGVSLVFLPWFFWLLTFLYRIISRACGFRLMCFGSSSDSYPENNTNLPAAHAGPVSNNAATIDIPVFNVTNNVDGGGSDDNAGNGILVNEVENRDREPGSPRRVRFGGVVILGDDDGDANGNEVSPKSLSRSSSSSSSSRHSNESELPLRLSMA